MMEPIFRKPLLEDKEVLENIYGLYEDINSESAFGTLFLWADAYNIEICIENGVLFKKFGFEDINYQFPLGCKSDLELKNAVEVLKKDSEKYGKLRFCGLLEWQANELQKLFPGRFLFKNQRDDYEYIYLAKDLAKLKGKKYHSKRNHISKFSKLYDWKYI